MAAVWVTQLVDIAARADLAGHGQRTAIYTAGAQTLGISLATFLRRLATVRLKSPRKVRVDCGATALTRAEALLIVAVIEESRRLTGSGTMTLERAVEILRNNGQIIAARVDETTGECQLLTLSAIARALRTYTLHPEQLQQPAPATRLKSPHPNWCWQIDASISRQYYLAEDGLTVMDRRVFYRGKPQNFVRVNENRLWRYAITDHASGFILVYYVRGAESSINLLASMIYAMTQRGDGGMHGVPRYLMSDPGSAVTAQTTRNFCAAVGIEVIVNQAGNARAKGQVENAHWLIEREFEAAMKLAAPLRNVAEVNTLAAEWNQRFCATRVHTRTNLTRRDGWSRITPEQLILAPLPDVLRTLANSTPKTCTVRDWRVKYRGAQYDLRSMGGVLNGSQVEVTANPFAADSIRVAQVAADGRPAHFVAPLIATDSWQFDADAATIGLEHKGVPDSAAETARKEIERLVMDVQTDAEAAAKRKAKRLPFAGSINPMRTPEHERIPAAIPRAGTPSTIVAPLLIAPVSAIPMLRPQPLPEERIAPVHLAQLLKRRLDARGANWTPALYELVLSRWPQGVTEDQIDDCVVVLLRGSMRVAGVAL